MYHFIHAHLIPIVMHPTEIQTIKEHGMINAEAFTWKLYFFMQQI
jgi:hypothetical protein